MVKMTRFINNNQLLLHLLYVIFCFQVAASPASPSCLDDHFQLMFRLGEKQSFNSDLKNDINPCRQQNHYLEMFSLCQPWIKLHFKNLSVLSCQAFSDSKLIKK